LLEVPTAALRRRFGAEAVTVDEEEARSARVVDGDLTLEVGFSGVFRMFGALIDTQWVGVRGELAEERVRLAYRFDKETFVVKHGADTGLAARLGGGATTTLAARSELKSIEVEDDGTGRRVVITPLPGTITAVYFPPMPPYSVPLKANEADDHIALALHLLQT
jgi:hypothetical protein